MSNQVQKIAMAAVTALPVIFASSAGALAAGPQEVKEFTDSVDAKGNPHLQGSATKYGKQLFVNGQPAQVDTKSCGGDLEIRYIEKGNQGTFWGLNIDDRDKGLVVDRAPKNDKAKMVPSNGYVAYDIGGQLGADWKDVVSKNVTTLRVIFPDGSACPSGGGSNPPGDTPELPGGGCSSGCPSGAVDARSVQPWKVGVPGFTMVG